jgi:hypothetical protein
MCLVLVARTLSRTRSHPLPLTLGACIDRRARITTMSSDRTSRLMDALCLAASYQDDCRCPARRCRQAANRRCAQVSRRSLGGATRRRRRRWPGHPLHAAHCTLRTAHSSCTLAYANRPLGATCRVLPTSSQHSSAILSPSLPVSWSGCRPRRHPPRSRYPGLRRGTRRCLSAHLCIRPNCTLLLLLR